MRTQTISKIFSFLAGLSGLSGIILTFGFVFGELPNPLPAALFANAWAAGPIFRWITGLSCITLGSMVITGLFIASSKIILVGWSQFIADEKEIAVQEKKANTRLVGELISVQADHDSSNDTDTSIVETTEGFYRVHGKVSMASKGEAVTIRTKSRGFFSFKMVCLDGREYQLVE